LLTASVGLAARAANGSSPDRRALFNMEPERVSWLGAPTIFEFTKTEEQRQVLSFFAGGTRQGRPILTPPGVPADRINALRRAFDATMKDAAFLKEAETMGFEVYPQTGEQIAALVAATLATPEDIVRRAERAATPD
jgi:hypothetical protein